MKVWLSKEARAKRRRMAKRAWAAEERANLLEIHNSELLDSVALLRAQLDALEQTP